MSDAAPPSNARPSLDPELRRQLVRWLWFWCGRLSVAVLLAWVVALGLLAAAFRFLGESNPFTAFVMFLPPALWLAPGIFLWPPTLLFRWRAALMLGLAALLLAFWTTGWRPGTPPAPVPPAQRASDTLVVLTNNRGQNGGQSLRPFKNHIQPDLMLFQESPAQASSYLADPGYSEFTHGQTVGEFTLISRFPVTAGTLLTWHGGGSSGRWPYGARFEMEWQGRKAAIYCIHLRSPRDPLYAMRGGAFLYGIPLPFGRWRQRSGQVRSFWQDQIAMAEDLMRHIKEEKLPCVVAGDFNAPHLGAIHRRLTQQLQDAHAEAGFGTGFTFPGETHNPLALGGPWLRIDYVLASPHWTTEVCWTEEGRRSQHRAVAAALKLKPAP